jgi:hypothetical protein
MPHNTLAGRVACSLGVVTAPSKMYAYAIRPYDILPVRCTPAAFKMHARERETPMRYTPMRCAHPVRCARPGDVLPEMQALKYTPPIRYMPLSPRKRELHILTQNAIPGIPYLNLGWTSRLHTPRLEPIIPLSWPFLNSSFTHLGATGS